LAQIEAAPQRVYLRNHLGRVYQGLGRPADAEQAWRDGVQIVRDHGLRDAVDIMIYSSLALNLIAAGQDASSIIEEGMRLDPEHHSLQLAAARQAAVDGRWSDVLVATERLIEVGRHDVHHEVFAYDRRTFGLWPMTLRAECLFELGRYAEAAEEYERAIAAGGSARELTIKAAVSRSMASSLDQEL
jgi:tetratricopeptide (TPR) repeat protein